ncbi:MAG: TonB family protein [Opitutae bacterium]|nr:TonB family protein [Opitutae bacterium]
MKTRLLVFLTLLAIAGSTRAAESARTAPKPIDPKMPAYPSALTDTGISGAASVELLVQTDGSVQNARVKSSDHPAFGDAALAAVTAWHFSPGMKEGVPVPMRMSIPFNFKAPFDQQLNAKLGRKVFTTLPQPALAPKAYGKKIKLKKDVDPVYPRQFMREKLEETVEVNFVIAPDGTTLNPVVAGQTRLEFKMAATPRQGRPRRLRRSHPHPEFLSARPPRTAGWRRFWRR